MRLAYPTSAEHAYWEMGALLRRGRTILVAATVVVIALLLVVVFSPSLLGKVPSSLLIPADFIIVLGIAGPGLTLYLMRVQAEKALRRGNAKVLSAWRKLIIVSINWIVLTAILVFIEFF